MPMMRFGNQDDDGDDDDDDDMTAESQ